MKAAELGGCALVHWAFWTAGNRVLGLNVRIQQPPDHALVLGVMLGCLRIEKIDTALTQR